MRFVPCLVPACPGQGPLQTRKDLMDELVKLVADKVGLPEPQARQAVETVLDFLKSKLPAPLAGRVEAVLEGDLSEPESLAGGLSGLFGIK